MSRGIARKFWIGAGLLCLLAAALVAIPSFVDANAYKPEIIAQVKRATGRDVTIEGPVRLSLLPAPVVTLDGLRVSNETGARSPNMVEAKSVAVRLSLLGLLTGELRPAEVILVEPRIFLQIDASGRPNWQFPTAPDSKTVSLPRLVIENGTLTLNDARSDLSIAAANADFSASAGSIDGPLSVTGGATVNDVLMKLDLAAGAKSTINGRVSLDGRRNPAGGWWQALLCRNRERARAECAIDGQGVCLGRQPRGVRPGTDRHDRPAAASLAALARRKVQVRWSGGARADDGLCQGLHAGSGR